MKFAPLFLSFLFTITCFAGGGKPVRSYDIHSYETNLNLLYHGIRGTVAYLDEKNKLQERTEVTNIAIYDIASDSVSFLFKDTVARVVLGLHYETEYIEQYQTVEFNNEYNPSHNYSSGLFSFSNNRNIERRPISNNIIVITESPDFATNTIWIADKYGNNLEKAFDFDDSWSWELDVKNRQVRIYRQVESDLEIRFRKY